MRRACHLRGAPERPRLAAGLSLDRQVREARLRYREEILNGLEPAPDAIAGLYRGENLGKRLIRVGPD
jgi:NADPH-dependent curcumin reductase CurA